MPSYTPIFIPGLLCNELLFAKQRAALPQKGQIVNIGHYSSITEMAQAALNECAGRLVPIGLSMGGYVALEIARIAPERVAGMALLSTNAREENNGSRMQRLQAIDLAKYKGFQGVTRHLMPRFLSKTALADERLVNDVLAMAADIGRLGFVKQQTAILGRRDQRDTLVDFTAPLLVLCGKQDVITPPALSAEMANLAPNSALCLLDGVGHLSSLEAPEEVTAALQELFKRIE